MRGKVPMTLAAIAALMLVATAGYGGSEVLSASDYGAKWPFTVASGRLACTGPGVVTFTANGKTYAVNGPAMSDKRNADIQEIWKPYTPIHEIIKRGVELCK
jgi:hypothetical protein